MTTCFGILFSQELRDPKVEVFTRPTVWIDRTEHVPREYVHPHLHPTYCPSWKSTVEAILTIGKKTMTYACRPLTKRVLKKMLATAGLNDSKRETLFLIVHSILRKITRKRPGVVL